MLAPCRAATEGGLKIGAFEMSLSFTKKMAALHRVMPKAGLRKGVGLLALASLLALQAHGLYHQAHLTDSAQAASSTAEVLSGAFADSQGDCFLCLQSARSFFTLATKTVRTERSCSYRVHVVYQASFESRSAVPGLARSPPA